MSKETPHTLNKDIPSTAQRRRFRIGLRGQVDREWMAAFAPISFSSTNSVTMIEVLADQAGLRGILNRLWDLNVDIFSVVEKASPPGGNGGK